MVGGRAFAQTSRSSCLRPQRALRKDRCHHPRVRRIYRALGARLSTSTAWLIDPTVASTRRSRPVRTLLIIVAVVAVTCAEIALLIWLSILTTTVSEDQQHPIAGPPRLATT
jgi:hypothetical protein